MPEHGYDKNLSPEARALRASLWEGWGCGRQTTDWPGEHHLEAAAAAVVQAAAPSLRQQGAEEERERLRDGLEERMPDWLLEEIRTGTADAMIQAILLMLEGARQGAVTAGDFGISLNQGDLFGRDHVGVERAIARGAVVQVVALDDLNKILSSLDPVAISAAHKAEQSEAAALDTHHREEGERG